jgi:hypothetical protein
MEADGNPLSDRQQTQSREPRSSAPSGFALLASRISSWTSKLILTGVILVAGLGFGRQVLRWWAADDPERMPAPAMSAGDRDGLGDEMLEHVLQFGDSPWSIRRQLVSGSLAEASALLRRRCRAATESATTPEGPPTDQERTFLASLEGMQPRQQEPGKWAMYQLDELVPMVVGVRARRNSSTLSGGSDIAQDDRRVVTWGLAVPASEGNWTLYTFVGATPTVGAGPGGEPIPLPDGCRRTMSMRVAGGSGIVAFRGAGSPRPWKEFFDRHFENLDWKADGGWQRTGSLWSRRYAESNAAGAAAVEVQFGADASGRQRGLLVVSPFTDESKESKGL